MGPSPVLICWQDEGIPSIASYTMGRYAAGVVPAEWPSKRFDLIWWLVSDGHAWSFAQVPQCVLSGDHSSAMQPRLSHRSG